MSKSKRRNSEEEDQRTLFRGHRVRHFSKSETATKHEPPPPIQLSLRQNLKRSA